MTIAIDFGTSNTVISRWNQTTKEAEIVKLPNISIISVQNPPLIPSLVYVENAAEKKVIIGQQVRDKGYDINTESRFFRNFKRGIGAKIQGFLPEIDGQIISFERVGKLFLEEVIGGILKIPLPVESLIFTVPVDSFETYRNWLGEVCQSLQVEQVRMIDEPTAAALGYGMADAEILLVVDFGGGTLDLSLVRLDNSMGKQPVGLILKWGEKSFSKSSNQKVKTARVLAKAGKNLGGSDIDNWLVDYFVKSQGIEKSPLITRLAEKLKIQLSLQQQGTEVFFDDESLESYELELGRDGFEEILRENGFFASLDESMSRVLQQAKRQGIELSEIGAVLLVGGTVQIPAVQRWVREYFDAGKIRCEKPFEAISQGALQLVQGVEVKDFLYHSYGIRYWDRKKNTHSWHPLIKSGQPYPMSSPIKLVLGASMNSQPSIELVLGELGAESDATEVYFDGDRLITRKISGEQTAVQLLNDREGGRSIAQLNPLGNPGRDRIKVLFWVDESRFLRITVEDLLTNETLLNEQAVVQLS